MPSDCAEATAVWRGESKRVGVGGMDRTYLQPKIALSAPVCQRLKFKTQAIEKFISDFADP